MTHAGIIKAVIVLRPCERLLLAARSIGQWTRTKDNILYGHVSSDKLQSRSIQKAARKRVAKYQNGRLAANVLVRKELTVVGRVGCEREIERGMSWQPNSPN